MAFLLRLILIAFRLVFLAYHWRERRALRLQRRLFTTALHCGAAPLLIQAAFTHEIIRITKRLKAIS